jgi:hypothetical protein
VNNPCEFTDDPSASNLKEVSPVEGVTQLASELNHQNTASLFPPYTWSDTQGNKGSTQNSRLDQAWVSF